MTYGAPTMGAFDLSLIAAFVAYALYTGFASRKDASLDPEHYFLAGRSISGWKAGLSMSATQYAADTPLVVTGLVATAGIYALWRFWIYSLAFLVLGFVLAGAWRRARVLTDAELCETRYAPPAAEPLRYLKAIYFGVVINCAVLAMVLLAATRITEPLLPWHTWLPEGALAPLAALLERLGATLTADPSGADVWLRSASNLASLLLIVGFTALYSTTGGLRSVIETDVVQIGVALLATAMYAWFLVSAVGGVERIPDRLAELYGQARADAILSFSPFDAASSVLAVVGLLGLQWVAQANSDGTGYLAQRTMACRSDRDAKVASVVFTYVQTVLRTLLWLPIVVALLVLYPVDPSAGADAVALREATFVRGIVDHLPPGAFGLMMVGLIAALASTVDTHLNWGASYFTNDLYARLWCRRIRGTEADARHQVWVARAASLLVLSISLAVMLRLESVQSAWKLSLLFGAGIGVPLLLRWVWHRHNAYGELVPMAGGLVVAPLVLTFLGDEALASHGLDADAADATRLITVACASVVLTLAGSLLSAPVPMSLLARFYARVRPPGFWGPVALECGDDPRTVRSELARDLGAAAAAAGSVFALVVGLGTLVVGAGGPAWMPRWLYVALWVGGALVLVRVWWRLAGLSEARLAGE